MPVFDLFSTAIRRFPPWAEAVKLHAKLAVGSLINVKEISDIRRSIRLQELERIESEQGFVYFGEKLWLQESSGRRDMIYSDWVREALTRSMKEVFPAEDVYFSEGKWVLAINGEALPPVIGRDSRNFYTTDTEFFNCHIFEEHGDGFPAGNWLVQVFHLTHNLSYYIEKSHEYHVRRGDIFSCDDEKDFPWTLRIYPSLANSRLWGLDFMAAGITYPFFEHEFFEPLADLGLSAAEIKKQLANDGFPIISDKDEAPFWM